MFKCILYQSYGLTNLYSVYNVRVNPKYLHTKSLTNKLSHFSILIINNSNLNILRALSNFQSYTSLNDLRLNVKNNPTSILRSHLTELLFDKNTENVIYSLILIRYSKIFRLFIKKYQYLLCKNNNHPYFSATFSFRKTPTSSSKPNS